jgi:hypothetical protein
MGMTARKDDDELGFEVDEIEGFVRGLDEEVTARAPLWAMYSRAFRSEFWSDRNPWSGLPGMGSSDDPFPVKIESNQIWPFVQAHVSNLFYRAPRTEIEFPAVTEVAKGRPYDDTTAARRIKAFADEWIRRSDSQEISTYALQLNLFHGLSAYKLGLKQRATGIMDRVWVDAIPYWELLWDDRARSFDQHTYRGHIRWERLDRAREIVDDDLVDVHGEVLPDVVDDEGTRGVERERRPKKFVRLLEFYDLIAGKQRFFVASGYGAGVSLKEYGSPLPIPWKLPNGRPGVPIIPMILSNEAGSPSKGVSAVARVYGIASETNLILTIAANQMRRDAASISVLDSSAPDSLVQAIKDAVDGTVVKLDKANTNIEKLVKTIDWGRRSESMDKYKKMLVDAKQDSQGMSDLMQGKQGNYLSATEADILAGSGETTAIEIGQRMSEAMARMVELVLVMIADTIGKDGKLHVRTVQARETLTHEELMLPWTVAIVDSGTTPVREGKRKQEFVAVQPVLISLATIASSKPAPAAGAPPDPAAAQQPQYSDETRLMAQQLLDYLVQLYGLPETMSWRSIVNGAKPVAEERAVDPETLAKAERLMERAIPAPILPPGVV